MRDTRYVNGASCGRRHAFFCRRGVFRVAPTSRVFCVRRRALVATGVTRFFCRRGVFGSRRRLRLKLNLRQVSQLHHHE